MALGERSERAVESAAIDRKLAAEDLRVVEVAADGHCLYRSIAHAVGGGATFAQMREMCAAFLGDHEEDFVPFAVPGPGAADGAAAFAAYRERVRASAEWGGQVELLALARALGRPIRVFSRDAPVLTMGEGEAGAPLVVAYHRHYYALGEHYNGTRGR